MINDTKTLYPKRRKEMKKLSVLVALLLLTGVLVSTASAGAFTYTSGIQVQNLSSTEANVTVAYYNKDGSVDATVPGTVPANGSVTYFPIGATDGFDGSVVISADQPVAAISNILGDSGLASASYVGASAGATTVNIPLLMYANSGFNTWFNVQNTGGADAEVSVAYSDGTSAGPVTIPAGAAYTFDQMTEGHTAGSVFSGVVTSDQPVAVSVIEESSAIMFAYSGFVGGSPTPVLPLINANNAGYQTGVQIQNTGATDTDVTLSYTAVTGTDCTETQTIPAESSATFALAAFANGANSTCVAGATFVGSAAVTVNTEGHDLTVIVNQLGASNGEAYGGFDPMAANDTVVMPLIMDRNSNYFTGFNIQNVGSDSTDVVCTFTDTTYEISDTLDAGEALNDLQANKIADGYVGSGTCTASGGTDNMIVGVVNELGPANDALLVYEGINP
jgi:hypothetical protein